MRCSSEGDRRSGLPSCSHADEPPPPILVALDPTGPAEEAERLALVLARATGADSCWPRCSRSSACARTCTRAATRRTCDGRPSDSSPSRAEALRRASAGRHRRHRDDRLRVGRARSAPARARAATPAWSSLGPSRRHGARPHRPGPDGHPLRARRSVPGRGRVRRRADRRPVPHRRGVRRRPTTGRQALRAAASLAERAGAALRVIAVAAPLPWMDLVEPGFDGIEPSGGYDGHVAYALETAVAELPTALPVEVEVPSGDPVEILAARLRRSRPAGVRVARPRPARRGRARQHLARPARGRALPGADRAPGRAGRSSRRQARGSQSRCFAA